MHASGEESAAQSVRSRTFVVRPSGLGAGQAWEGITVQPDFRAAIKGYATRLRSVRGTAAKEVRNEKGAIAWPAFWKRYAKRRWVIR